MEHYLTRYGQNWLAEIQNLGSCSNDLSDISWGNLNCHTEPFHIVKLSSGERKSVKLSNSLTLHGQDKEMYGKHLTRCVWGLGTPDWFEFGPVGEEVEKISLLESKKGSDWFNCLNNLLTICKLFKNMV